MQPRGPKACIWPGNKRAAATSVQPMRRETVTRHVRTLINIIAMTLFPYCPDRSLVQHKKVYRVLCWLPIDELQASSIQEDAYPVFSAPRLP